MSRYSILLFFVLLLGSTWCYAQDDNDRSQEKNYFMSLPVDLPQAGVNRVLCMKNGNTMLFHFENNRPIVLKIFDSSHKRIINKELSCDITDLNSLSSTVFKGLFEVNGEGVLFFEQENSGRHILIRLRFNGSTGRMIEEEIVGRSKSLARPTRFYVMKNKGEDSYAILYSADVPQFRQCKLNVTYYNGRHEVYKDVPINFDRKKYDYLNVLGAEVQPNGVCVTLGLSTMATNGTNTALRDMDLTAMPEYDHYLLTAYIPAGENVPKMNLADVSRSVYPYYTHYTYNPFAKTVGLFLFSYMDILYRYGIEVRPAAIMSNLFFHFDEEDLRGSYSWVDNKKAQRSLPRATDTGRNFQVVPLKMFTNQNGLSTVVSESFYRYNNVESYARSRVFETYLGNICITQLDDDGKELWGITLPKAQYFKSYRHYYYANELGKRWQDQLLLDDQPQPVYNRQFLSCNTCSRGSDTYVIYNDNAKNFNNSIEHPGDTVFSFDLTNACYYKVNRKKEVVKKYLFGEPASKEYKCSFIEGADLDEQRGVYASLIQYKRGDYVSLRMAWRKLD